MFYEQFQKPTKFHSLFKAPFLGIKVCSYFNLINNNLIGQLNDIFVVLQLSLNCGLMSMEDMHRQVNDLFLRPLLSHTLFITANSVLI